MIDALECFTFTGTITVEGRHITNLIFADDIAGYKLRRTCKSYEPT